MKNPCNFHLRGFINHCLRPDGHKGPHRLLRLDIEPWPVEVEVKVRVP